MFLTLLLDETSWIFPSFVLIAFYYVIQALVVFFVIRFFYRMNKRIVMMSADIKTLMVLNEQSHEEKRNASNP